MPPRLTRLLLWAQAAEQAAVGSERRRAFRFTRQVIGGLVEAGYPLELVADCLQTSVGSARGRAQEGGWVLGTKVEHGAGLAPGALERLEESKLLTGMHLGGGIFYSAVEVVLALGRRLED